MAPVSSTWTAIGLRPVVGLTACVAVMLAASPSAAQQQVQPKENGVTAFVDVAVIPMDRERVLLHQTVLVQGERIVALGPTRQVRVPTGAWRIDGRGQYLLPGLADMHVHISYDTVLVADDSWVPGALWFFVAQGVTTVRDLWSGPAHLQLKARIARGELLGPRLYTAWRPELCGREGENLTACIAAKQQAGYDFLKIEGENRTGQAFLDSVMIAAAQVGLRVVGHVLDSVGLERTLAAPYASIEHLGGYFEYLTRAPGAPVGTGTIPENGGLGDTLAAWAQPGFRWDTAKLHAIAVATRRAGVWQTPTLRAVEIRTCASGAEGKKQGQSPPCRWVQLRRQIAQALRDAGVGLLAGTDIALPETSHPATRVPVHAELQALVAAGLTPYEALVTATRNPAAFLGTLPQTGTIVSGKVADLVLLDGNPLAGLEPLVHPAGVMLRGRWFSRAELDAGLPPQKLAP